MWGTRDSNGALPTDGEGYCHTTVRGWLRAGKSRAEAREMAAVAKEAVAEAEARLAEWQNLHRHRARIN